MQGDRSRTMPLSLIQREYRVIVQDGWVQFGLCRGFPTRWWFPDKGNKADLAYWLCAQCPVKEACADYAIEGFIEFGIWGGLNEKGRREKRRQRKKQVARTAARPGA